ncbi:hypothetical protein V8G54_033024 [Vigna mungo]|uniref:Uncharacterized protein n=1 Tax=Vigna mungo TaxID=3915 RepID=A0AAQ3MN65_VIGMU
MLTGIQSLHLSLVSKASPLLIREMFLKTTCREYVQNKSETPSKLTVFSLSKNLLVSCLHPFPPFQPCFHQTLASSFRISPHIFHFFLSNYPNFNFITFSRHK